MQDLLRLKSQASGGRATKQSKQFLQVKQGKGMGSLIDNHDKEAPEAKDALAADTIASQGTAMVSVKGVDQGKTEQSEVDMSTGSG